MSLFDIWFNFQPFKPITFVTCYFRTEKEQSFITGMDRCSSYKKSFLTNFEKNNPFT